MSKRFSLYIYQELLEKGTGSRPVKNFQKVKRFGGQGSAYIKVLERVCKYACDKVYELEEKKIPYSRVIVSALRDTQEAKQDLEAFEYAGPNGTKLGVRPLW